MAEPLSMMDAVEARALMQQSQWVLQLGTYPGLPGIDEVDEGD